MTMQPAAHDRGAPHSTGSAAMLAAVAVSRRMQPAATVDTDRGTPDFSGSAAMLAAVVVS
jgi:hypothetical protein